MAQSISCVMSELSPPEKYSIPIKFLCRNDSKDENLAIVTFFWHGTNASRKDRKLWMSRTCMSLPLRKAENARRYMFIKLQ
mmetsp:Transcript_6688/g.12248  ORF Transcript_6688/g.12248 Transcript_6688/m.12248 type:complete len:81 (-) Transcript_6688:625-867(-)